MYLVYDLGQAVPVVRVVPIRAVCGPLVTTSMWQRGGCSNVAATSTWLGAAAGAGRAGRAGPVGLVRRMRCRRQAHKTRSVQSPGLSLPKSRTHVTWMRLFSRESHENRYLASRVSLAARLPQGRSRFRPTATGTM